jgi:hypothetical protein
LIVTYATKVTGLGIVIQQVFLVPTTNNVTLALAGFMMAGAQVSENALMALLDRLLGPAKEEKT